MIFRAKLVLTWSTCVRELHKCAPPFLMKTAFHPWKFRLLILSDGAKDEWLGFHWKVQNVGVYSTSFVSHLRQLLSDGCCPKNNRATSICKNVLVILTYRIPPKITLQAWFCIQYSINRTMCGNLIPRRIKLRWCIWDANFPNVASYIVRVLSMRLYSEAQKFRRDHLFFTK